MNTVSQKFSFSILKSFTEKIFLTIAFVLPTLQALAQVGDNFTDGDFTADPVWTGTDAKFSATSNQLQLVAPNVTETAYLSTSSQAINDARWEFLVRLEFNPSSTNYARVYLTADQVDLSSSLNGYFVMIGNTSDEISLYKQTGVTRTKIIDGLDGRINLTVVDARIRITRDASGTWELFSDVGLTGTEVSEGATNDVEHLSSGYFGVFCNYTATRSDKFYFDDFVVVGDPYEPPKPPTYKDVIVTEIFADPSPTIDLPPVEYIELFNRSTNSFNLSGWKFTDGSSTATLSNYTLNPNDYLILTSNTNVLDLSGYGNVLGLSSFPSLNNTGDSLVIKHADETVIDIVKFTDDWYQSDEKKEGGWSLELIDVNNPCGERDNWTASEDQKGGTPGQQNSVFANKPDLSGPKLLSVVATDSVHLLLMFNEKLKAQIPGGNDFQITPPMEIDSVLFADYSLSNLELVINQPLQKKQLYTLTAQNIRDCNGNLISEDFNDADFGVSETAEKMDVVINEILFNPRPTGVDFVEIVNASDKFIDLKNWSLGNMNETSVIENKVIGASHYLLKPGDYLIVTENGDIVNGEYPQSQEERFLESDLPALNDEEGSIALVNETGLVVDSLFYSKGMHSVFIKDEEGVSLERISFTHPTNNIQNWKSASSLAGFATPGFLNSNARPDAEISDESVKVNPEIFIPVNGQPNFTQIQFAFKKGGYVANVKVFDAHGHLIRALANNEILGTEGFLQWEGDRDDGSQALVGYYMLWFEVFDSSGVVKTFRKRVAIAGKF